jgi:hypothetical protein
LLVFITVSFILGTLFIASLAEFTQLAFVQYRNYPGGPSAFEDEMFSIPIDNLGNVTGILIMLLTDALVVSTKPRAGDLIFYIPQHRSGAVWSFTLSADSHCGSS